MAPAHVDYNCINTNELSYTHKKFNNPYTHKKFGKRSEKDVDICTAQASPLFRPYALNENTPRKRRLEAEQQQQPTQQSFYTHITEPTAAPVWSIPPPAQPQCRPVHAPIPAPTLNHQAFAYMLQKQRAVLQMRQLLSINPNANTWPTEWRNALFALLQR